jgi:predicted nucleic acid-binding protein
LAIVLDTWALLAHLRDEAAAEQVRKEWIKRGAAMCSVNLGEALYLEMRVRGPDNGDETIEEARRELDVIHPDWKLVAAAAKVKASGDLSFADAFCIATAERLDTPFGPATPRSSTEQRNFSARSRIFAGNECGSRIAGSATVSILEANDVIELRCRNLKDDGVLQSLDRVDPPGLVAPAVARLNHLRLEFCRARAGGQPQAAREQVGGLVLLAVELQRKLLPFLDDKDLRRVVLRLRPPDLVPPGLLNALRLPLHGASLDRRRADGASTNSDPANPA